MATLMVNFDRELRRLEPDDAAAWRAWLTQHQLDHMLIACPSNLIYRPATKRKLATLTLELLNRDNTGSLRSKRTITVASEVLPFPPGFKVEKFASSNNRRASVGS